MEGCLAKPIIPCLFLGAKCCKNLPLKGGPARDRAWEKRRSPRFLGNPSCTRAPFLDPGGTTNPHQHGSAATAFPFSETVDPTGTYFPGSIPRPTYPLSTLYVMGHPTPHQTRFSPAG